MMNCENYREWISAYLDQMLTPEENTAFEKHIGICSDCMEELEQMTFIVEQCNTIPMEPLPENFVVGLHQLLEKEADQNRSTRESIKLVTIARRLTPIAAGILLVVAVSLFAGSFGRVLFGGMKKSDNVSDSMATETHAMAMTAKGSFEDKSELKNDGAKQKSKEGEAMERSAKGEDMATTTSEDEMMVTMDINGEALPNAITFSESQYYMMTGDGLNIYNGTPELMDKYVTISIGGLQEVGTVNSKLTTIVNTLNAEAITVINTEEPVDLISGEQLYTIAFNKKMLEDITSGNAVQLYFNRTFAENPSKEGDAADTGEGSENDSAEESGSANTGKTDDSFGGSNDNGTGINSHAGNTYGSDEENLADLQNTMNKKISQVEFLETDISRQAVIIEVNNTNLSKLRAQFMKEWQIEILPFKELETDRLLVMIKLSLR